MKYTAAIIGICLTIIALGWLNRQEQRMKRQARPAPNRVAAWRAWN